MTNFTAIRILTAIATLGTISSCKKIDLSSMKPNNNLFGQQCVNDKNHPVSSSSKYQALVFKDTFNGGSQSDPCFSMKPRCSERLDWFSSGICKFDANDSKYAGIKNLNKCNWKVWSGWDFWAGNHQITFDPQAIEVSGGTMKLKILGNPNFDPNKEACGEKDPAHEWDAQYFNLNCPLIAGAVDSKYSDSENKGRNMQYGRVEIRARFMMTSPRSSYPALWMWPDKLGTGHPYTATTGNANGNNEPDPICEMDILELNSADSSNYIFQSLHNWRFNKTNKSSYVSNSRAVHMSDWHNYGLEWSPGVIKFIIDDCYTTEIKTGDKNNRGLPGNMSVPDTASFIMMWSGGGGATMDNSNRDIFEIDEVRIYE